ncbi:MAG: glycosyltransferase family 2 protein [Pseudomonadota bacterium]
MGVAVSSDGKSGKWPDCGQSGDETSIDVCICTFKRHSVVDTIASIAQQELPKNTRVRVIVADNDEASIKEDELLALGHRLGIALVYRHAPARNISIARNACLDAAQADWVAFIDDDEVAEPDWLAQLLASARAQQAEAVFGPAMAVYPDTAPRWMRANDFHSNIPTRRGDTVETGYSCNVLMRWREGLAPAQRFRLELGRTGGEDTEFFFRLFRAGGQLGIAWDAIVREPVAEKRMSASWIFRRKLATGAIYGAFAPDQDGRGRATVFVLAMAKAAYCALRALPAAVNSERLAFWAMRGAFHIGVCTGCLRPPRAEMYGHG